MTVEDDDAVVAAQVGRPLRARADVVVRCALGLPVVSRVPPRLDDGEPFPTRYWLTCPLADRRIARLEAAGGVREADARVASDSEFAKALVAAHRAHAEDRDGAWAPGARGIGGATGGVKCLHAHYAHFLATGASPVGESIHGRVGPLDCPVRCVRTIEGRAVRDPDWREPA